MLVGISWSVGAVLDLVDSTLPSSVRHGFSLFAVVLVLLGSVAYGCLTADSVTGRVQTLEQGRLVTAWSVGMLVAAAGTSVLATATVHRPRPKGEDA